MPGHDGRHLAAQPQRRAARRALATRRRVNLPAAPYLHLFVPRGRVTVEGVGELNAGDAVRFTDADGRRVTARRPGGSPDLGDARQTGRLGHIELGTTDRSPHVSIAAAARGAEPQARRTSPADACGSGRCPSSSRLALMSALCALYLGGILNPTTNLRHFPIAVVNEDAGPRPASRSSTA